MRLNERYADVTTALQRTGAPNSTSGTVSGRGLELCLFDAGGSEKRATVLYGLAMCGVFVPLYILIVCCVYIDLTFEFCLFPLLEE
jgi:hypothetical protein